MRYLISLLACIMLLFIGNITAYILSEDYRAFVKSVKYNEDTLRVDDSEQYKLVESISSDGSVQTQVEKVDDSLFFLPSEDTILAQNYEPSLRDLVSGEQFVLDTFEQSFIFTPQKVSGHEMFGLTEEYPDEYRFYTDLDTEFYIFSTHSYAEMLSFFDILSYDMPISLNETNSFWTRSFFINMNKDQEDWYVRIVFEYENMAFWLKIKKDSYNKAKSQLEQLN